MLTPPLLITIEGTIGAGKSTVMRALREQYAGNAAVTFVDEPVDAWIGARTETGDSVNLLDAMYRGEVRTAYWTHIALIAPREPCT